MGLVLVRASVWSTEQVSLAMHHCALGSLLLRTGEGGEAKEATKGQLEERGGGQSVVLAVNAVVVTAALCLSVSICWNVGGSPKWR